MGMTINNLCNSCTNIGCEFQSGIVRTECAFYMPTHLEPDNCGNYIIQAPTIKNNLAVDCISRQAVLELIADYDLSMGQVVRGIHALPSVTPQEPRKGHWISHREHCENLGVIPSGLGAYEWCSNCDCGIDVREWHRNHYNYCPNCGCRMVETQESEVENG